MNDAKYQAWLAPRIRLANEIKAFRSRVGGALTSQLAAWVNVRRDEDPLAGKPAFSVDGELTQKIAADIAPKIEVKSSQDDTLSFDFSPIAPEMKIHGPSLKLTTGEDLGEYTVTSAELVGDELNLRMKHTSTEPDAEVSLSVILSAFEDAVFRSP